VHDTQGARGRGQRCPSLTGRSGRRRRQGETTRIEDGAAPTGKGMRGKVSGYGSDAGVLGQLGRDTSTSRPPGVRRNAVCQSTVERGKRNMTKSMACTVRL
jgi:hypothetical protein